MIFPFKRNQSKDCLERRSSIRTWKSGSNKIIIKDCMRRIRREHDIRFKQNVNNKNCMRRTSCMNLCKKKRIPNFSTIKLCLLNTVENDHQTITFSYLCLILRKISIEVKGQRSKILSLRVAPPIPQFGHVACLPHPTWCILVSQSFSYFEYCQIWLNLLMDDCHMINITKLKKNEFAQHLSQALNAM